MYDISDELKAKYTDDASHTINYFVEFYYVMDMDNNQPIFTIENDNLVYETMKIKSGLSGGDTLEIGSVYTTEITFNSADVTENLVGKYIKVYQTVDDMDEKLPIGRFIVTSVEKTSDKRIKTVTAYDYTAVLNEAGNNLFYDMRNCKTIGSALEMISSHYGLEWAEKDTTAWDYELSFDYTQSVDGNFTSKDLLAMLGELLGGWIRVNRDGKLYLKTITKPSIDNIEEIEYFRSNPDYGENETGLIENLSFTNTDDVLYKANNSDGLTIDMSGNFFLIGGISRNIIKFLKLALSRINTIQYYPAELSIDARPYLDVGDFVRFNDGETELYTFIKERTLSGIQRQIDTYSCKTYSSTTGVDYSSASAEQKTISGQIKRVNYTMREKQQELANALSDNAGMYETREQQSDGSFILYLHNKKELSESDIIIKVTTEAIGFSTDSGQTYPYGIKIDGDVIANILSANGISADWINAGTIDGVSAIIQNGEIGGFTISNGKLIGTAKVFINPAEEDKETARDYVYGKTTLTKEQLDAFDFNMDGVVDNLDRAYIKMFLLGTGDLPSDYVEQHKTTVTITIDPSNENFISIKYRNAFKSKDVDVHLGTNLSKFTSAQFDSLECSNFKSNGIANEGGIISLKAEDASWYKLCTITVNSTYANEQIVLHCTQRGFAGDIIVKLTNSGSFSKYASRTIITGTLSDVRIKTSSSNSNFTIDVYIYCSANDIFSVLSVEMGAYVLNRVSLDWVGEAVDDPADASELVSSVYRNAKENISSPVDIGDIVIVSAYGGVSQKAIYLITGTSSYEEIVSSTSNKIFSVSDGIATLTYTGSTTIMRVIRS